MSKGLRAWAVVLVAGVLWLAATIGLRGPSGLTRTIVSNSPDSVLIDTRAVRSIALDDVDAAAGGPGGVTVYWRGVWQIPNDGFYTLTFDSPGPARWTLDEAVALQTAPTSDRVTRTVWLTSGFHPIEISYSFSGAAHFSISAGRVGETAGPLSPASLKRRPPRNPFLRSVGRVVTMALGWIAVIAAIVAIRRLPLPARPQWSPAIGKRAAWVALAGILAYGALLRIDAVTARYGVVSSPRWMAALQTRGVLPIAAIRPPSMIWEPEPLYPHADGVATRYRSDPYIYLDIARKMTAFYEPQFREPLFPFATKLFLRAFAGQDVAVSFASAFFSLLAVWLTYLLGSALWSRPVGLLAALGLAMDYDVISLASLGWRDDAYVAMVVACGYWMVRCWRAAAANGRASRLGAWRLDSAYVEAIALGVTGGYAILTRIMAVPMLMAGAVVFVIALGVPMRRRLTIVGIAAAFAAIVAGPYFLNCWRVWGDPLYTFNVHGGIYSISEGHEEWKGTTASYVWQKVETRPFDTLDTVAQGVTTYPFNNKWHGLDRWTSGAGEWAAIAALAGLVLLAALAEGRLIIVAMAGSLVPFAFTWKVDPHFRFTEHAYPTLLIAAALAIVILTRATASVLAPGWFRDKWWRGTSWRAWAGVTASAVLVLWIIARVSPAWVFAETLTGREDANVTAGVRDAAFFGSGWTPVLRSGNVSLRVTEHVGTFRVTLPAPGDYPATLRLDPFPEPFEAGAAGRLTAEILLNGASVATLPIRWTPGRVGSYDIVLPRASVRRGSNVITVRTQGGAIGLWYARVHPAASAR